MSASKVVSAREVLSDFLNQGHLEYRVPGRVSDYDRADAMIRDLEAEGLAIVPADALAALSRERDEAREALHRAHDVAVSKAFALDREADATSSSIRKMQGATAAVIANDIFAIVQGLSREGGKQDQGDAE